MLDINQLFSDMKYSVSADKLDVDVTGAKDQNERDNIEKKFWGNYRNVLVALERRLCQGEPQWFGGISDNGVYSLLETMKGTSKKLRWPVEAYQPQQNAPYTVKLRPVVALLHNVYDLQNQKEISPVKFLNPELPMISVNMRAELDGNSFPSREGITIKLPVDYMKIIFGLDQLNAGEIKDLNYVMEPAPGALTEKPKPVQPTTQTITAATQII